MRFLLREQAYERLLLAGKYVYQRDDVPTGAVEWWRLTAVPEQYQILRVDLDGRASSGDSYLYHALLDADGLVSRLQYRFWSKAGLRVSGNIQREGDTAVCTHTINNQTHSQALTLTTGFPLWFPSVMGLHWAGAGRGVTLHGRVGDSDTLTPYMATVQVDHEQISWVDLHHQTQTRMVGRDEQTGWPRKMARLLPDGGGWLTAVASSWQVYGENR
jgi:hypothetical protein